MKQNRSIEDIFSDVGESTPEEDTAYILKLKGLYRFNKAEIDQEVKEIFLFAASKLEKQGVLGRGKMFDLSIKPCIMCAHGAIAYSSDTIRNLIDGDVKNHPAGIDAVLLLIEGSESMSEFSKGLEPEEYLYGYYGSLGVAHYRAMKAGLTFSFNDEASLEEVVGKLRELSNG